MSVAAAAAELSRRERYPHQQGANKKYQNQARWRCRSRDHEIRWRSPGGQETEASSTGWPSVWPAGWLVGWRADGEKSGTRRRKFRRKATAGKIRKPPSPCVRDRTRKAATVAVNPLGPQALKSLLTGGHDFGNHDGPDIIPSTKLYARSCFGRAFDSFFLFFPRNDRTEFSRNAIAARPRGKQNSDLRRRSRGSRPTGRRNVWRYHQNRFRPKIN